MCVCVQFGKGGRGGGNCCFLIVAAFFFFFFFFWGGGCLIGYEKCTACNILGIDDLESRQLDLY